MPHDADAPASPVTQDTELASPRNLKALVESELARERKGHRAPQA